MKTGGGAAEALAHMGIREDDIKLSPNDLRYSFPRRHAGEVVTARPYMLAQTAERVARIASADKPLEKTMASKQLRSTVKEAVQEFIHCYDQYTDQRGLTAFIDNIDSLSKRAFAIMFSDRKEKNRKKWTDYDEYVFVEKIRFYYGMEQKYLAPTKDVFASIAMKNQKFDEKELLLYQAKAMSYEL